MFVANTCEFIILIWFIIKVNKIDAAFLCSDCKNEIIPAKNRISCDDDDNCDGNIEENSEYDDIVNKAKNCKWMKGKYLCENNLQCIDFNQTCNGKCDCSDCSDEKRECDQELGNYTRTVSSNPCFKTPNGPYCCLEFDSVCRECDKHECEQKCIEFAQEPRCLCDENYIGVNGTNNRQCASKEVEKSLLIYSTEKSIGALDLFTNRSQIITTEILHITALTAAHDLIYYANFTNGTGLIFKIGITSNETHLVTKSDSKILSIAIDWITNTIYYSTNTSKIVACSINGKMCEHLKSCNASSIGLAPRFGLLFWVQTKDNADTSQYIMKSGMDGSDEILLTNGDKISWPITISVDELTEKIYFWTSAQELSYVTFDGKNKKIFLSNTYSSTDRVSFTVFEKKVYFSFSNSNQIQFTNDTFKLYAATLQTSFVNSTSILNLYAYNPRLQLTKILNPCDGICTDGLCLLRPTSLKTSLNYTCYRSLVFEAPNQSSKPLSNKGGSNFVDIATYVFVALVISVFLIVMVKNLYDRWKNEQFRNSQSVETGLPPESRENNELLKDADESSKLNKDEYVKNNSNEPGYSEEKENELK